MVGPLIVYLVLIGRTGQHANRCSLSAVASSENSYERTKNWLRRHSWSKCRSVSPRPSVRQPTAVLTTTTTTTTIIATRCSKAAQATVAVPRGHAGLCCPRSHKAH
ncbi:unnamed protein product [Schistocephalus solidus]|uniref:Secreted protein n=1 Tax=Schistocephalus solidus TaxID=70667 RepID=A0A183T0D8_SCHSO|nr:unnamed protein product [Schistocephalus solidus]